MGPRSAAGFRGSAAPAAFRRSGLAICDTLHDGPLPDLHGDRFRPRRRDRVERPVAIAAARVALAARWVGDPRSSPPRCDARSARAGGGRGVGALACSGDRRDPRRYRVHSGLSARFRRGGAACAPAPRAPPWRRSRDRLVAGRGPLPCGSRRAIAGGHPRRVRARSGRDAGVVSALSVAATRRPAASGRPSAPRPRGGRSRSRHRRDWRPAAW